MLSQDLKKFELPDFPGVYYFLNKEGEILYIGKATSLSDRVKSYFSKDLGKTRGPLLLKMVEESVSLKYAETPSVLEALILEAKEIKKYKPYYNSKEKDDRSYNYILLTKEEFPRILTIRERTLKSQAQSIPSSILRQDQRQPTVLATFGPFPHGGELREALKIIRRIFPYRDEKCKIGKTPKPCFPAQLGLCPGPCAGWVTKKEYAKNIRHIKMFFEARKPELIKELEKEMNTLAKAQKFEEAEKIKRQIYALEHIQDIALIKRDAEGVNGTKESGFRIEAYDIAHLSGKEVVGVMTVVCEGELDKSQYRKFKIRADKNNDVANLKEVLIRRFNHPEWRLPDLIVVDGGAAQINAAEEVLRNLGQEIRVVSVVKDQRHKAREILGEDKYMEEHKKDILLANSEAHRFAISYHRKLRTKGFRI